MCACVRQMASQVSMCCSSELQLERLQSIDVLAIKLVRNLIHCSDSETICAPNACDFLYQKIQGSPNESGLKSRVPRHKETQQGKLNTIHENAIFWAWLVDSCSKIIL